MAADIIETTPTLHVEHCMGTVFTIDIRDPGSWAEAVSHVVRWLHHVDAVFSTYKDDSDISQIRSGDLAVADADPEVAHVFAMCEDAARQTDGYFSMHADGGIDPTGLVKGWAIERASQLLRTLGSGNHAVNGGGDIQLAGHAGPGQLWTVGISDPRDSARLLTTVQGHDFAVATSGIAERGTHIIDPHTGEPAGELVSATVVGRSLTSVDAYATAAFAMGTKARSWIEDLPGHEAFLVSATGEVTSTSGFHRPAGPPRLVRTTGNSSRRRKRTRGTAV